MSQMMNETVNDDNPRRAKRRIAQRKRRAAYSVPLSTNTSNVSNVREQNIGQILSSRIYNNSDNNTTTRMCQRNQEDEQLHRKVLKALSNAASNANYYGILRNNSRDNTTTEHIYMIDNHDPAEASNQLDEHDCDSDLSDPENNDLLVSNMITMNIDVTAEDTQSAQCSTNFKTYMQNHFFSDTLDEFCRICDRIWWRKNVHRLENMKQEIAELIKSYLKTTQYAHLPNSEIILCSNCFYNLRRRQIPSMASINGFAFPYKTENLPELNELEQRLISPRLPFMQIQNLHYFPGAKKLIGQVINIPIDVNNTVKCLPRQLDDDYVINVCLKRNLLNKSSYMSNCVVKKNIKLWLKYLVTTPLYLKYKISIDPVFFKNYDEIDNDDSDKEDASLTLPILSSDSENEYVENRSRQEDWQNVMREIERHKLISSVSNNTLEYMTGEELMDLHQHTLFWGEDYILNIAPGMHERPLALSFDEDAEELAFPTIYFGIPREEKNGVRITPFMRTTSEIRHRDRRTVTPDHILYMAGKILRLRVINNFNVMFRTNNNTENITRDQLEDREFIKQTMMNNDSFLRSIPNSAQYWGQRKDDLFAMIRQLGKPTIFLTLSASEIHWPHLLAAAFKFAQGGFDADVASNINVDFSIFTDMSATDKALLINNDPVISCLYFHKLILTIISAVKKNISAFGKYKVKDFFKRIEFQQRGSPHAHILLWLDHAPDSDDLNNTDNINEIITLIDSISTVDSSMLAGSRPLQTHKQTHTCNKKNSNECRFHAPFWPMNSTCILEPLPAEQYDKSIFQRYQVIHKNVEFVEYSSLEAFFQHNCIETEDEYIHILRHGLKRPRIFLKRSLKDIWTSPFNPIISSVLQSNMDIQYILDGYSCCSYVVDYVNKAERGYSNLHREMIRLRDERPELDYEQCMRELGKRTINNIELSTQEAAWFLLKLPMSASSRKVQYIPTNHPAERYKCVKKKKTMIKENVNADSNDIWTNNCIQNYEKRPQQLNNTCLADYVAWYTKSYDKLQPSIENDNHHENDNDDDEDDASDTESHTEPIIKKRSYAKVIRWKYYEPNDTLNYKRMMVLLFYPFRNEELELLDNDNFLNIYQEKEDEIFKNYEQYTRQDIEYLKNCVRQLYNDIMSEQSVQTESVRMSHSNDPTDDIEMNVDIHTTTSSIHTVSSAVISHADYCRMVCSLNIGQKSIVLDYISRLVYEKTPLQIFLTGPAGSESYNGNS